MLYNGQLVILMKPNMQKAIIDNKTGVVLRLTIEESPQISSTENIVELKEQIDLSGGYFKLDEKQNKILASQQEIIDSNVDDDITASKLSERKQVFIRSIEAAIINKADTTSLVKFLQAFKDTL